MEKCRVERFPILLHMPALEDAHIAQVDADSDIGIRKCLSGCRRYLKTARVRL